MYHNIGDSIIKTLITTDYTKRKLNHLILFCVTLIIRSIINGIISYIIFTNIIYVDFVLQILLSIFFLLKTNRIYNYILKYRKKSLYVSHYLIDTYSPEQFRKWKKHVVLFMSSYCIIYLLIFSITSTIVITYIIQFLICYFIVDNIENRDGMIFNTFSKVDNYIMNKRMVRIYKKGDVIIIDNYKDYDGIELTDDLQSNNCDESNNDPQDNNSIDNELNNFINNDNQNNDPIDMNEFILFDETRYKKYY